jgi:hypothetical protein
MWVIALNICTLACFKRLQLVVWLLKILARLSTHQQNSLQLDNFSFVFNTWKINNKNHIGHILSACSETVTTFHSFSQKPSGCTSNLQKKVHTIKKTNYVTFAIQLKF